MKSILIALLLILSYLAYACSDKNEIKKIHISTATDLPGLSFDESVTFVRTVNLEFTSESMIGEIFKIFRIKDQIFIWDYFGNTVYKFMIDGRFISKTKRGMGPNEIGDILHVGIDTCTASIYINDMATDEFVLLDYYLNVKGKYSKKSVNNFFVYNSIVYGIYNSGHGNDKRTLVVQNPNSNLVKMFLPKLFDLSYGIGRNHSFSFDKSKVYYLDNFRYFIFSVDQEKMTSEYLLDLADDYKISKQRTIEENEKLIHDQKIIVHFDNFFKNDQNVFFSYSYLGRKYYLIYNLDKDLTNNYLGIKGITFAKLNITKETIHSDKIAVSQLMIEPINKEMFLVIESDSDILQNPTLVFFKIRERIEAL